jgi:hypothetical protein
MVLQNQSIYAKNTRDSKYCDPYRAQPLLIYRNKIIPCEVTITKNTPCDEAIAAQMNAKKRMRSSNIIKNDYSTNTPQFLQKRNRSFEQNKLPFISVENCSNVPTEKYTNIQFHENGAVSSSSLVARKNYTTNYYGSTKRLF